MELTKNSCDHSGDQLRCVDLALELDSLQLIFENDEVLLVVVIGSSWQWHELVVFRDFLENARLHDLVFEKRADNDASLGRVFIELRDVLERVLLA